MGLCPFLTTPKEKVGCFRECCFYKEGSKCIFVIYDEKKGCDLNEIEYEESVYEGNMKDDEIRDTSLEAYTYLNV